jgi:hypothetical protein
MTFVITRVIGAQIHYYTPTGCWDSSAYAAARLSQSAVDVIATMLRDHYGDDAILVFQSPIG